MTLDQGVNQYQKTENTVALTSDELKRLERMKINNLSRTSQVSHPEPLSLNIINLSNSPTYTEQTII